MPAAAITVKDVSMSYIINRGWAFANAKQTSGNITVLEDISLAIRQGEIFVILGPSGSGKSTLLRILSGLELPSEGHVAFAPGFGKKERSFVFQQFALLPWLTVRENVGLGLTARHVAEKTKQRLVERELRQLGLGAFSNAYPRALSGGMRQRVGIARALATEPKIIFMDEPFSELDSFTAEELRTALLTIWQSRHPTIILVTHLIEEALKLADRIAVLTPRPAKIERILTNPLPRPRNRRSREFFALEDKLTALVKP